MRGTTANRMCTHLFQDNRPRLLSIPVTATCTTSETKARFQRQPSPFNLCRSIRLKPIDGLTLQPQRTVPTLCKYGRTRLEPTRPPTRLYRLSGFDRIPTLAIFVRQSPRPETLSIDRYVIMNIS